MTSADLLALAERVEAAKGADRELDAAVWWEVDRQAFASSYWRGALGLPRELTAMPTSGIGWQSVLIYAPRYSVSLDAAKSLKHHGDLWCVGSMEDGPFARVVPAMPGGRFGDEITVHAETVECALTSAFLRAISLRARAATEQGG